MQSFLFVADSSCPVPRPAPELLEIVVKQKEGNQNWRAKYIVATKVTHQDKFRQRPHHAVSSCMRVWLGEIHTLTVPDGSARWQDSDDDEPLPPPPAAAAATGSAPKKGKTADKGAAASSTKALPTVSPSVAGAAAAAVAAASAAAANDAANAAAAAAAAAAGGQQGAEAPAPPAGQPQLPQLPGLPNMPNLYGQASSIAQYMPLLSSVLSPAPSFPGGPGANLAALPPGRLKEVMRGDGKKSRLPVLPDLLVCLRPSEEWGPHRAPILFVQTHGGQEYLLLKHQMTYILDVPVEHEVLSVRISMKNEKPRTLKHWKFENPQHRPAVGQGQVDLEDITKSLPEGMVVPIIYPPGTGDSPFHALHIDKELHPTLPTVVLHQLHEPQHLHTEQTFFITPLAKAQRKIRKVLLPPPPSKPSSTKQQQIHAAAAGVISAIATGGNIHEASANLAATKAKKRAGSAKKKGADDPISILLNTMPAGMLPGQPLTPAQLAAAHAAAQASAQAMMEDASSDEDEPAGLDGLGRKRKRKWPPPSVAARLKPSHPVNIAAAAAAAAAGMGLNLDEMPQFDMSAMSQYYASLAKKQQEEETDDEVTEDEAETAAEQAGAAAAGGVHKADEASLLMSIHGAKQKRKKKKARLSTDVSIAPSTQMTAFIGAHDPKWLTKASHTIWTELKKQRAYHPQAFSKEQAAAIVSAATRAKQEAAKNGDPKSAAAVKAAAAAASEEVKQLPVIPAGHAPLYATVQCDWEKLAKMIGEGGSTPILGSDVQALWKYVSDHMQARKAVDLDELDLRSLWSKDGPATKKPRVGAAPFPFMGMLPGLPNLPGFPFPGAPGAKAPTPAELEAQSNMIKNMMSNAAAAGGQGGAPLASPLLSMLMNPSGGAGALPGLPGAGGADEDPERSAEMKRKLMALFNPTMGGVNLKEMMKTNPYFQQLMAGAAGSLPAMPSFPGPPGAPQQPQPQQGAKPEDHKMEH